MALLVEIGPGRGDFLFWLAESRPDDSIVGIEVRPKRYEKLIRRIEKNGLKNIRLILGDARAVLPDEFATGSVTELYILFNDPWPKRRHTRRRLFQEGLVEEILRITAPGGKVFIATDDPRYKEEIQAFFRLYPPLLFSEDGLHFPTFYAQKWQAEGRTLYSFSYKKRSDAEPALEST